MNDATETIIRSTELKTALEPLAKVLKWGTLVIEVKDGKVVMTRVQKDIKLS